MNPAIGFARGLPGHPAAMQELSFAYAWLEAPLKVCLAYLKDVPDWQNLTTWPAGRVFGEYGEYRWQWESSNKALHTVLLLDNGVLPPEFIENCVDLQPGNDAALILWGEWVDPDPEKDPEGNPDSGPIFYANEIPRVQRYPVSIDPENPPPEEQTPRLIIRRYRAVKEDEGEFVRCVGFAMKDREE